MLGMYVHETDVIQCWWNRTVIVVCVNFWVQKKLVKTANCCFNPSSSLGENIIGPTESPNTGQINRIQLIVCVKPSSGPQSSTLTRSCDLAQVSSVTLSHTSVLEPFQQMAGARWHLGITILLPFLLNSQILQFTRVDKCHQMSSKCQGLRHEDGHVHLNACVCAQTVHVKTQDVKLLENNPPPLTSSAKSLILRKIQRSKLSTTLV